MVKRINLALQGGGAHGAFTWGVLDRLLECPEIEIAGISGTSAGAVNGAALKSGMVIGGRERARETLEWVWSGIAGIKDADLTAWLSAHAPPTAQINAAIEMSLPYRLGDYLAQTTSPYLTGPFYRNPLERIVTHMHFGSVCSDEGPALYVCATNVRTGRIRVFEGGEISGKALMASACLPTLFRAVEIADPDGTVDAYWDGGYSGNPALFPLYRPELPNDVVIVNINPLERPGLPYAAQDIMNRVNEISFNAALLGELRSIRFVARLIESGTLPPGSMKKVLVHMIADDELMRTLSVATKTVPSAIIIDRMKTAGRQAADRFLDAHLGDLNERGSIDLAEMFD